MVKVKSSLVAVLDIGSTKIVCLIARINAQGQCTILGNGYHASAGIKAGTITDIKQAAKAIIAAIEDAEAKAFQRVESVLISIGGNKITTHRVHAQLPLTGTPITEREMMKVIHSAISQLRDNADHTIHYFPLNYTIDDVEGIKDPRGMIGQKLRCTLQVVRASATTVSNLANCLAKCQVDVKEIIASPYAAGLGCLTADELELGTVVIDLGGNNTTIAYFQSNQPLILDTVAVGSAHITRDIAFGLSIPLQDAERLKTLYGHAIRSFGDEESFIEVPRYDAFNHHCETIPMPYAQLTNIIRPRVEEIFELIRMKLMHKREDTAFIQRIVLTGGGANLTGIDKFASEFFNCHVRFGLPLFNERFTTDPSLEETIKNYFYTTAVGMLTYTLSHFSKQRKNTVETEEAPPTKWGKVIKWLQENF